MFSRARTSLGEPEPSEPQSLWRLIVDQSDLGHRIQGKTVRSTVFGEGNNTCLIGFEDGTHVEIAANESQTAYWAYLRVAILEPEPPKRTLVIAPSCLLEEKLAERPGADGLRNSAPRAVCPLERYEHIIVYGTSIPPIAWLRDNLNAPGVTVEFRL